MPRLALPRIAAMALALAVVGISLSSAAPASAEAGLLPPKIVGSIDQIAVTYGTNDDRPGLHVSGWAANLVVPSQNGLSGAMGVELTAAPAAGGAAQTIGWVEGKNFTLPRPDVAKAFPGLGANHGWDTDGGVLSHPGTWKICARIWDMDAWMPTIGWVPLACATVTVPAHRPAYRPSISPNTRYGQTAQVTSPVPPATGSTVTYQWYQGTDVGSALLPGATRSEFVPGIPQIGRALFAITRLHQPGVAVIEQPTTTPWVSYGSGRPDRVWGDDRYWTSVAASQRAFPDSAAGAPVAYLVSGQNYPDALSAGPAAAKQGATMLLTRSNALPASVASELIRLHPATVVVVGGPVAVRDAVLASVRALPFAPAVVRVAGSNRYATSRAVVQYAFGNAAPNLFLATGRSFPDALAAGSAAASEGVPVLLTDGSLARADSATVAALRSFGTTNVSIVGGTTVVHPGVASTLGSAITVTRLAGSDRFGTAAAIASTMPPSTLVYLANGYGYPDALVESVLAARDHAPLLLSSGTCIPQNALASMVRRGVDHEVVVGGNSVMSVDTMDLTACMR